MIRFLAEVTSRFDAPIKPTPSNGVERQSNIYELDVKPYPEKTYWTDWGGTYDNFSGPRIELYFGLFLTPVNSLKELKNSPNSFFIDNGSLTLYINIPKHPWLYSDSAIEAEHIIPFLSTCLKADNPSDNKLLGVNTPVKLDMPSLTVKLSDNISDIILNQIFQVSLHNNDGYFDDDVAWNIFNTPVRLRKSIKKNPEYGDFKTIRSGLAENTSTNFDSFDIDVADKQRSMDGPVCNVITADKYSYADEKSINKNIPIVYGRKKVKLIKLSDTKHVAAEYVSQIMGVFNKDGVSQSYSYDAVTNIITSTKEAETAIITGYPANKISEVIRDILARKAFINFGETNWNVSEYERYDETSPRVNIAIESGTVKSAIQNVLKSDMAFLIQQNNGKLTVRRYGTVYNTNRIPAWAITQKPEKTWSSAQEKYFSSCVINYGFEDNEHKSFLFADREYEAEDNYRRRVTKTFDTELYDIKDVALLAEKLSDRYSTMKQTLKLPIGIDTSEFELMDRVICNANINGRKFSGGEYFIIKEIDPAQDVLTLEELEIFDLTGEYPNTGSHVYDVDNLYAYTPSEEFKYLIEGGRQ